MTTEQIENNQDSNKKKYSKLTILSLILVVFVLVMIPLFLQAIKPLKKLGCYGTFMALSSSITVYSNDYDGKLPPIDKWCDVLTENNYFPSKGLRCPGASEGPCNYAMNKNLANFDIEAYFKNLDLSHISYDNLVMFFETYPGWNQAGDADILNTENHSGKGCHILFVDGHYEFVEVKDFDKLKWKAGN